MSAIEEVGEEKERRRKRVGFCVVF